LIFRILTGAWLLAAFLSFSSLYGQSPAGILRGKVVDETLQGIDGAVISLMHSDDSTGVSTTLSDTSGRFEFGQLPVTGYFLIINYFGYGDYTSASFRLPEDRDTLQLADIILRPQTNELSEITIKGEKRLLERKADRVILNVDALLSNAGSNALDVLKKSPGLIVDENGNISLRGKSGVLVFIDDKPSYLSPPELAAYLQSLPASALSQVEIMTNPPARYDAAGNAGAVNIRLKKSIQKGFNGNINLGYNQGHYARFNNSLNLNYNIRKVNFFSTLTYNNLVSSQHLDLERHYYHEDGTESGAFYQNTFIKDRSSGPKLRLGLDYYPNATSTLGISFSGFRWFSNQRSLNEATLTAINGQPANNIHADATAKRPFYNFTTNINYSYKPDSSGREITFNADYLHFNSTLKNSLLNEIFLPDGTLESTSNLIGRLPSSINILSTSGDYTSSAGKIASINAGYKISYIETKNIADFYDEKGGVLEPNSSFTNHFNYRENINAAYINFNIEKKRLAVQAGLRYENNLINGHQVGDVNRPDSSFNRVFNSLFPTLYISYKFDTAHIHILNCSYGRRVDRPNYQDLNPFTYPIDRYTLYGGNPYLLPSFSNNLELSYSFKSAFTATLFYSLVQDVIAETIEQENGIFYSRPGNIGTQYAYGITINATFNPFKRWSVNGYSSLTGNRFIADIYGHPLDNKGLSWSASMFNQFKITDRWSAELSGYYQTTSYYAQFIMIPTGAVHIACSRKIWKDRATVKIGVQDIFFSNKLGGKITGLVNSSAQWRNRTDSRYVSFAFSYRFNRGKAMKERKSGDIDSERNRVRL